MGDTKHGMMKFREDRSLLGLGLPSGGFHDRYFILNSSCLRLYKEIRVGGPAGFCLAKGPAPECAQTRMHRCSLGFASGSVSIEGSWANTAVALGGYSALF